MVRFLIGCLDAGGYLRISAPEIADATGTSIGEVEEALQILWSMDPPGIGARDLRECLMLQIKAKQPHAADQGETSGRLACDEDNHRSVGAF